VASARRLRSRPLGLGDFGLSGFGPGDFGLGGFGPATPVSAARPRRPRSHGVRSGDSGLGGFGLTGFGPAALAWAAGLRRSDVGFSASAASTWISEGGRRLSKCRGSGELYEAAVIDGCSHFRYFLRVVLPLAKPVIAVIGLYYFVGHWNDFFTGLVYIRDKNLVPLQLVLRDILIANQVFKEGAGLGGEAGGYAQRYADAIKYALIIVSSVPVLVLYPFLQRYFEKGVMIGAIKG